MNQAQNPDYGAALDKLAAASKQLKNRVWDEINNTVEGEPYDAVWKSLCELSAAVQAAEWAYRRIPGGKKEAMP
jgi:hypothetical protein